MRRPLSRPFTLSSMSALTALALAAAGVCAQGSAPTAGPSLERVATQAALGGADSGSTASGPEGNIQRPTTPLGAPSATQIPAEGTSQTQPGTAPSGNGSSAKTKTAHKPGVHAEVTVDCAKVKCVALTFDDGPGPYTAKLLTYLDRGHAKATFFLLGQQAKHYPELVKAQAKAGMELGNHTWNHPQLSRLKKSAVNSQVDRTNKAIARASGGTKPVFLRPPYGDLLRSQRATVSMPLALWDVDTLDWKTRSTKATIKSAAAAKPGDIVLMHDIHESTVEAVPQIVKKLQAKGIHLVTLSTLMGGKVEEHIEYGAGLRPGK